MIPLYGQFKSVFYKTMFDPKINHNIYLKSCEISYLSKIKNLKVFINTVPQVLQESIRILLQNVKNIL